MASSRSIYSDGSYVLGLLSILLLIQRGGAYEFKVGGSSGWSVPSDAQSYNQWAGKNRFQIGDTLCKSLNHVITMILCAHKPTAIIIRIPKFQKLFTLSTASWFRKPNLHTRASASLYSISGENHGY